MPKVFRKLRQKLLGENRFKKYVIYALGEIVLVVIGILIALWINNANLTRQLQSKEHAYLTGLKKEFEISKAKLEALIRINSDHYHGALQLAEMTARTDSTLTEARFSELLFQSFASDIAFDPNNALLQEMINSGSLNNISNQELRLQLTSWMVALTDVERQESDLNAQRLQVLDMFRTDSLSIRTILDLTETSSALGLKPKTKFPSNLALLRSKAFENNLLMFALTSQSTQLSHYQPLLQDLNSIIEQIDSSISN
jgi:hypothetical protein